MISYQTISQQPISFLQNWQFKLRVTVGRAVVRSSRSIKLVNDVELATSAKKDPAETAMLIVAFGKTFSVTESAPKKLIMNTLARAAIERDRVLDGGGVVCDETSQLLQGRGVDASQQKPMASPSTQNNTMARQKVTFVEDVDGTNEPMVANSPR